MKRIITFAVAIGFSFNVHGQAKPPSDFQSVNLQTVYSKLSAYTDSLFINTTVLNDCLSDYMFIRFATDKKGNIAAIATNNGTPPLLDSIFRKGLLRTNGLWSPTVANKYYLLPVYYNLTKGCAIDTSSAKYTTLEWKLKAIVDLENSKKTQRAPTAHSFLNMLNFEKSQNKAKLPKPVDAILLPPFNLSNPVISGHPY